MSINWENLRSEGHFATYDPPIEHGHQTLIFRLECRCCGFEPANGATPSVCPKCGGSAWERFARPGSIFESETGMICVRLPNGARRRPTSAELR
jgi:hypothetical protein